MPRLRPIEEMASLVEVLQARAQATPESLAFSFLIDGEEEGPRLTFADLDRAARSIAATLRDSAEPGARALLVFEPGIEFVPAFFGCLYAGVLPVPCYPPRLDRLAQSWQALANLVTDCHPRSVLTTSQLAGGLARGLANATKDCLPLMVATDQVDASHARRWREPPIGPDTLAFLQYTSGATAAPKGVMVTHGNLMHNERVIQSALEHQGEGVGVCWLPLYHDLGLIAGALQGVYHGAPVVLMSPLGMLQRPLRWLRAISRYRADTSGGPNFAYDLCVQRVTEEEKRELDLSKWSIAAIGSEPVSWASMTRFSNAFASCGFHSEAFYPCYGLAEGTLMVAGGAKGSGPRFLSIQVNSLEEGHVVEAAHGTAGTRTLVGCGRPWSDQKLEIVNPRTCARCSGDAIGEIWVKGPSVASGYWNRPEETGRVFCARLSDTGEGPFLRTGDLGFVRARELFITGRLKDMIIVRGRNHYPEDIEATVQSVHPGLRSGHGAAFEMDGGEQARLVIVQEVDRRARGLDVQALIGEIRQAVAEVHEIQVHDVVLVESGSVPKTSSGKVQRHACRAGYRNGALRSRGAT
jgi:acyl-CoA synthetase (AMP-forming)/AMP-acid ligase II